MEYAVQAQERPQEAQVKRTFKKVKEMIDAEGFVKMNRPACPDAIINELVKTKASVQKIEEVRKALDKIANTIENWTTTEIAFVPLQNDKVASLFVSEPGKLADALAEITRITGCGLIVHKIVDATAAKEGNNLIFENTSEEKVVKIFVDYANGKASFGTLMQTIQFYGYYEANSGRFGKLQNDDPEKLFSLFSEIAKIMGSYAVRAFDTLISKKLDIADFLKIARAGGPSAVKLLLGYESDFEARTMAENIKKVKNEVDFLNANYGIEFFERFSKKMLENAYLTATDPKFSKGKRIALVILNKNDDARTYEHGAREYESLIDNGYCLVFCEAKDDKEMAERFFNHGTREGGKRTLADRKYDLLVIAGHGSPQKIRFNKGFDETSFLGLEDFSKRGLKLGSWNGMFAPDAAIVLISCSTGKDMSSGGITGNFTNIMSMISALALGTDVFAPEVDTYLKSFIFDNDGKCVGVNYREGKTRKARMEKIEK